MLSSFTHPRVVLNMYDFSSIVVNKEIFFCPYYKSEWSSFFFIYLIDSYCNGKNQWDIPQNIYLFHRGKKVWNDWEGEYMMKEFSFLGELSLYFRRLWIEFTAWKKISKKCMCKFDSHWITVHKWSRMYRNCWFDVHAKASPSHTHTHNCPHPPLQPPARSGALVDPGLAQPGDHAVLIFLLAWMAHWHVVYLD